MSVKEERKVEVRCDRCNALIKSITDSGQGVEGAADENNEPDLRISTGGKVVMEYADLCEKCRAVFENAVERLGTIERGNRKPRKKPSDKDGGAETKNKKKK